MVKAVLLQARQCVIRVAFVKRKKMEVRVDIDFETMTGSPFWGVVYGYFTSADPLLTMILGFGRTVSGQRPLGEKALRPHCRPGKIISVVALM